MQKRQPVNFLDAMTVFQEDLEIMNGYTHEQVVQYIANAEQSLKDIEQGTIPDSDENDEHDYYIKRNKYYKEPFSLFTNIDPGSTYYRFSLVPYDESIKEEFRDEQYDIGNYIKTDYDYIDSVEFCLATYHGYLKALEKDFQEGVSTHAESFIKDYEEFLHITSLKNKVDLQSVKDLVDNQHFQPAILEDAANHQLQYNNTELTEFFLQNGLRATDRLIECAAKSSSKEMMELLVRYGGNIHANSEAALQRACSHGNAEIAKYILENGADLKAANSYEHSENTIGSFCLDSAVYQNHKEVVEILLDHGVDINEDERANPLARSIQRGHYDMAEFLLDRGADHEIALKEMGYRGKVVLPEAKEDEQTKNPALWQLRQQLQANEKKLDAETQRNVDWLLDTVGKMQLAKKLEGTLHKSSKADRLVSSINEDAEAPAKKSKATKQKI